MSKELKAFREICKNLNSYEFTDEYKKNKKLIETKLKRLEELEKDKKYLEKEVERYSRLYENFKGGYIEQKTTLEEQDKILRIIKEKEVALDKLIHYLKINACDDSVLCWYNEYAVKFEDGKPLTQEEYDLLKEVLL